MSSPDFLVKHYAGTVTYNVRDCTCFTSIIWT
jgi:myosin heavy subunit